MPNAIDPTFHDMSSADANALLERNHIGRIAYSFRDRVDIEPISYVFADGAIYMRTSPGSKLTTLAHAPWVAFEVDEVDGPFEWRSVVAHGTVYVLEDHGTPGTRAHYESAVGRLQSLNPLALTEHDPVPHRFVVLKLFLDTVVGRSSELLAGSS